MPHPQVDRRSLIRGVPRAGRVIALAIGFASALLVPAHADVTTVTFTAVIGTSNSVDQGNLFGQGAGANLAGQVIDGFALINPAALTQGCGPGGACYGDFGAGAITVAFTIAGVTQTLTSSGTLGYFGNTSGGLVAINDPADGGDNYLSLGATSADGMIQESLGALFSDATLFSAYGGDLANPDPAAAIGSLAAIGNGSGLVAGGITLLTPIEHIDATITAIAVPEPASLTLLAAGVAAASVRRRRRAAPIPPG